jgi:hypothetical protein
MVDTSLAIEEYGLGAPLEERDLDLCYGLATVETRSAINANAELIIGAGLARYLNDEVPNKIHTSSPPEQAFNPTSLLGSTVIQNAYAFGGVFLRAWKNMGVSSFDVQVEVLRGSGGGNPLLMFKDVSQSEAISWISQNIIGQTTVPAPPGWATEYKTVEIIKFLIDIDYFDANNSSKNRINVIPVDKRKPRGALGFAEEALGAFLVPALIQSAPINQEQYNQVNESIKVMVDQWVQLDSWEPNFLSYWQTSIVEMPSRLREYLETELGYVV